MTTNGEHHPRWGRSDTISLCGLIFIIALVVLLTGCVHGDPVSASEAAVTYSSMTNGPKCYLVLKLHDPNTQVPDSVQVVCS